MEIAKLQARRSVIQLCKKQGDLPKLALYTEWLGGTNQRKVVDTEGKDHVLDDKIVQSLYKLVTGAKGKKLMADHWQELTKKKA